MAPVDSGAPQGAQPSSQPPCAAPPQQPTLLPNRATLNNMDYRPDDNLVEGFTQRWLDRDKFVTECWGSAAHIGCAEGSPPCGAPEAAVYGALMGMDCYGGTEG